VKFETLLTIVFPGLKRTGLEGDMYLLPRLRIGGGIPLLRHMPECHVVGQLEPALRHTLLSH
jgi:hypothetical protein